MTLFGGNQKAFSLVTQLVNNGRSRPCVLLICKNFSSSAFGLNGAAVMTERDCCLGGCVVVAVRVTSNK